MLRTSPSGVGRPNRPCRRRESLRPRSCPLDRRVRGSEVPAVTTTACPAPGPLATMTETAPNRICRVGGELVPIRMTGATTVRCSGNVIPRPELSVVPSRCLERDPVNSLPTNGGRVAAAVFFQGWPLVSISPSDSVWGRAGPVGWSGPPRSIDHQPRSRPPSCLVGAFDNDVWFSPGSGRGTCHRRTFSMCTSAFASPPMCPRGPRGLPPGLSAIGTTPGVSRVGGGHTLHKDEGVVRCCDSSAPPLLHRPTKRSAFSRSYDTRSSSVEAR